MEERKIRPASCGKEGGRNGGCKKRSPRHRDETEKRMKERRSSQDAERTPVETTFV